MEPSQQHPGPGFGVGLGASGPALTSPFASQEAGGGGVGEGVLAFGLHLRRWQNSSAMWTQWRPRAGALGGTHPDAPDHQKHTHLPPGGVRSWVKPPGGVPESVSPKTLFKCRFSLLCFALKKTERIQALGLAGKRSGNGKRKWHGLGSAQIGPTWASQARSGRREGRG